MKTNNDNSKSKTLEKYRGQYNDAKLSSKIARFAKSAGMECVYYVLLLVSIMKSKDVKLKDKIIIGGALGYFISPLDLIPDLMIGTGYLDDVGMLYYALTTISSQITPAIRRDAIKSLHKYFDFRDEDFKPKI
jgi:uncharacterized membrane protein YkvA (DUF1232 family)